MRKTCRGKIFLIFLMPLFQFVSGCAVLPQAPTPEEIANADYGLTMTQRDCQNAVREFVQKTLIDPDSAKYEFGYCSKGYMGAVPLKGMPKAYGYSVVVSINAKNRFGGYAGRSEYSYLINNGVVIRACEFIQSNSSVRSCIPFYYQ